ncbi:MAG: sigma-70 family RNA polymerase sigma factor [Actinomycetota bacterium]|nr:sigma-70 family RNA polymerase sigma factor [Actinomycetota bacterium]
MPLGDEVVAAIYVEHADMLRRFALRAVHDPGRAEDLVQEVVFRAWRRSPAPDDMRSYLLASARNLVIDQYRAAARRPQESQDAAIPETPGASDPESEVNRLLDQILVEDALTRLQPDHRNVVQALYFAGMSVQQAADTLGVPAGTVKSRAYYAVRSLRTILDEMGVQQ